MKELSIEQKAKAYDEAIEREKKWYNAPNIDKMPTYGNRVIEEIFPELRESEDERIRKAIMCGMNALKDQKKETFAAIPIDDCIAWLEKQYCEPNWYHHKVDLSTCSEEYRKAYYDGWNNCNMQHSQCKSELDDVVKCLINGMKFYYEDNEEATWGTDKWSMPVKHIIEVLEKQGEPTDINPSEFDLRLNKLLKQFETLSKEELANCLSFYLNVVQNDGTYKHEEKQGEQKPDKIQLGKKYKCIASPRYASKGSRMKQVLENLLSDLKKLREE